MNPKHSSEADARPGRIPEQAAMVIRYYEMAHDSGPATAERLPYRITDSGAWASSRPAHLFHFFTEIDLTRYKLFLDLGSGDGIATCIAALFTRAIGIESDPQLVAAAGRASRSLGLAGRADFIRADFFTQRIISADCLYIYPDKPVYALEESLQGWDGTLLIYGPHFPPKTLRLTNKLKYGEETLSVYAGRSRD